MYNHSAWLFLVGGFGLICVFAMYILMYITMTNFGKGLKDRCKIVHYT